MFIDKNLNVLAGANGFTLWHYGTLDNLVTIMDRRDYFVGACHMLKVGDRIMVNSGLPGIDLQSFDLVVTECNNSYITVVLWG